MVVPVVSCQGVAGGEGGGGWIILFYYTGIGTTFDSQKERYNSLQLTPSSCKGQNIFDPWLKTYTWLDV